MGEFSNPLVGGQGILVRDYIRSKNYSPGVAGWTINRDGTAEFSDILIRGTIELPPNVSPGEVGTIWWNDGNTQEHAQIWRQNGTVLISGGSDSTVGIHDSFIQLGKESAAGDDGFLELSVRGTQTSTNGCEILMQDGLKLYGPAAPTATSRGPRLFLNGGEVQLLGPGAVGDPVDLAVGVDGVRIGNNGLFGLAYSESRKMTSGTVIANGTKLNYDLANNNDSDYDNSYGYNPFLLPPGQWVAPVDGWYSHTYELASAGNFTAASVVVFNIQLNTVTYKQIETDVATGRPFRQVVSFTDKYAQGDSITVTMSLATTPATFTSVAITNKASFILHH